MLTPEMNFVTVEDPVEYQLEGVNQVQVNVKRGLTFAGALRSILRQDPDIVMVGEIRDTETIEIAVKAALTGHLVLSTLHTNDAASTVTRMVGHGRRPVHGRRRPRCSCRAQRLMRRLCEHCRRPVDAPAERLLAIGYTEEEATGGHQFFTRRRAARGATAATRAASRSSRRCPCGTRSSGSSSTGAVRWTSSSAAVEGGMITLRRCALLNAMRGGRRSRRPCA